MAEAPCSALACSKLVRRDKSGLLHPTDHELGDPVPAMHLVRGTGIGVDKYDRELAPVTGVDEARGV
jgi:hypothetical protein